MTIEEIGELTDEVAGVLEARTRYQSQPYIVRGRRDDRPSWRTGVIEQILVRTDGIGAVTVVEAPSLHEGVQMLHQLPLVANGCISIEAVPVTESTPLARSDRNSWGQSRAVQSWGTPTQAEEEAHGRGRRSSRRFLWSMTDR